ncbi:unnamed protein product [Schistosoma mattheei]|uniref:Uncharacterized protein n=1 Tax=Schistosoma mattheei TaxID=31246 RepID=A0A183PR21_9TREM|nr:unnamed protein product [Schistosoma mattheei]
MEDDLISGLLIEQIAHCVLSLKRPMLRKFAFRMALAAHRYARAKQVIYDISVMMDHINFNVGKQAYLIGDLNTSCKALAETLNSSSRQSAERQLIFVKEYLSTLTVSRLCCTFFQFHFTLLNIGYKFIYNSLSSTFC